MSKNIFCQNNGAKSISMGNASVTNIDIWAIKNNPASLSKLASSEFNLGYNNRFQIKELAHKTCLFVLPQKYGAWGASISQYGHQQFKETEISISYSLRVSRSLWMGVNLNRHSVILSDTYSKINKSAFSFDIGILTQLSNNILLAVMINNPSQQQIVYNNSIEGLKTKVRVGVSCLLSPEIILTCELEQKVNEASILKSGIEYKFLRYTAFRFGFSSLNKTPSIGIGHKFKFINLNIAFSKHPQLGFYPTADIGISLPNKNRTKNILSL